MFRERLTRFLNRHQLALAGFVLVVGTVIAGWVLLHPIPTSESDAAFTKQDDERKDEPVVFANPDAPLPPVDLVRLQSLLKGKVVVSAYQINGLDEGAKARSSVPRFGGYPVFTTVGVLSPDVANRILVLLGTQEHWGSGGFGCFWPGLAFRLDGNNEALDVLLCLHCRWGYFFRDDQQVGVFAISSEGVKQFTNLYRELFKDSTPTLVANLDKHDDHTARGAISHLCAIGKDAVPALEEALESPIALVRGRAVHALGGIEGEVDAALLSRVKASLTRLLNDPEENVRASARHALDEIGKRRK